MSVGAFSLDQLMELAGLSVSQAGKQGLGRFIRLEVSSVPAFSLSGTPTKQRKESACSMWARKQWQMMLYFFCCRKCLLLKAVTDWWQHVTYFTMATSPLSSTLSRPSRISMRSDIDLLSRQHYLTQLQRLSTQLKNLDIPFTEDFESSLNSTNHVVDAIFGRYYLRLVDLLTNLRQASASRAKSETHSVQ